MTPKTHCWPRLAAMLSAAALTVAVAGCATTAPAVTTTPGGVPIDIRYNSANQDSRALFLVLHYTVADLPLSIKVLTETPHEVSAHYLVRPMASALRVVVARVAC